MTDAERSMRTLCFDCDRAYGDEHGFPDLIVPHDVWKKIAPFEGNGLLCPSCLCKRAHNAGIECAAFFTSGPFVSDEILRLRTALAASEATLEKARQALKPFASLADGYADGRDDDHHVIGAQVALKDWRVITAGDIRRAATALKDTDK